jgi:hypothetical protein
MDTKTRADVMIETVCAFDYRINYLLFSQTPVEAWTSPLSEDTQLGPIM